MFKTQYLCLVIPYETPCVQSGAKYLHLVLSQQAKAGAVAATDPQEPDGGGDHVPALELRSHHR